MDQNQFEQLLAWTMLGALHGAVLEQQQILGRVLTPEEYTACHKTTHRNAEMLREQLQLARGPSGR
jgi:hypothetical protein